MERSTPPPAVSAAQNRRGLFPENEPFNSGWLPTGGEHEIKEATLYATYRRLEKDGLVESYWGDETQGGRRKYYRITDAGRAVFNGNVAAWVATRRIIDSLLDVKGTDVKGTQDQ